MLLIGLLAQTNPAIEASTPLIDTGHADLLQLVLSADIIVQLMLLILVIFSILSWAIISNKYHQLRSSRKRSHHFFRLFWESKTIDVLLNNRSFRKSPAFNIFRSAIETLRDNHKNITPYTMEKDIQRATDNEIQGLESGISFLATTSSAAPFIGLFGTIWGILHAFWKIGRTGASSIAIIGPHIAEALISTALGLAAAIPAVIFYNYYTRRIRLLSKDLYDFADDLNERINNEYFVQKTQD